MSRISLTVDKTANKYVKIQLVDGANAAVGYGDVLYPQHHAIWRISSVDGKTITINQQGGYLSGSHGGGIVIPYDEIVLYNGVAPPSIATILADLHAVLIV